MKKNMVLHGYNICAKPFRLRSSSKKLLLSIRTCAHFVSEVAREQRRRGEKCVSADSSYAPLHDAHLFRTRPCNRSVYVTEKAVRLPRYYELRANVTQSTSHRLVRDALFPRDPFLLFIEPRVPYHAGNFLFDCPHLTAGSAFAMRRWLNCITRFWRTLNAARTRVPRHTRFPNLISVEVCN